jgi:hypothetical protein
VRPQGFFLAKRLQSNPPTDACKGLKSHDLVKLVELEKDIASDLKQAEKPELIGQINDLPVDLRYAIDVENRWCLYSQDAKGGLGGIFREAAWRKEARDFLKSLIRQAKAYIDKVYPRQMPLDEEEREDLRVLEANFAKSRSQKKK